MSTLIVSEEASRLFVSSEESVRRPLSAQRARRPSLKATTVPPGIFTPCRVQFQSVFRGLLAEPYRSAGEFQRIGTKTRRTDGFRGRV
jgi:hypothetical protein